MAEADVAPAVTEDPDAADKPAALTSRITGSLARRMIAIAALWISVLLIGGGFALDRVLTRNGPTPTSFRRIASCTRCATSRG